MVNLPFPTVSHGALTPGKAPRRRTGVPACGFLRPLPDAPYRPAPLRYAGMRAFVRCRCSASASPALAALESGRTGGAPAPRLDRLGGAVLAAARRSTRSGWDSKVGWLARAGHDHSR